jgi:hypothetical protein
MGPTSDEPLLIDCDDCSMQGTSTCDDCIVTFLCSDEADDGTGPTGSAVVIDVAEVRALRLLAESGLAPPLRHRRHAG